MLIGYSQPAISGSVGIASGGGLAASAWLTADGGAALFDGRPSRKARLQWGTGTASIAHYVAITATFAAATPLRILALLGTTLPVGCRVDFLGAGGDGLGGTCDSARTVRMPDGTVGVWAVAREDDPAETGVEIRIYNDVDGLPWASAGTVVDVGEAVSMPGVKVPNEPGWELGAPGVMAERFRTRSAALNTVAAGYYNTMRFVSQAAYVDQVRHGALANGMDWLALRRAMQNDARIAVVPRLNSASEVNATAHYGVAANVGNVVHLGGDYYQWTWDFEEVPSR